MKFFADRDMALIVSWYQRTKPNQRFAMLFCFLTFRFRFLACDSDIPLVYNIMEELPAGTLIGNIVMDTELTDKYDHSTISKLRFSFLTRPKLTKSYLAIEEVGGILRTTAKIDRDKLCPAREDCPLRYDVAVQPVQFFQIIKVIIEVVDINDNQPQFPRRDMVFGMSESSALGSSLAIPPAVDHDSGNNGIQGYELLPSDGRPFELRYRIAADGSTDLRLVLKSHLDREKKNFHHMQIIAQDAGLPPKSGSLLITVRVSDSNDNEPAFENSTYESFVVENVLPGTTVIRVRAIDTDEGPNGEVIYDFTRNSEQEYGSIFGIDANTGSIYVKETLDHETQSIYLLSVVARDRGADSLPSYASVIIRVQDMNDNAPVITISTLTMSTDGEIPENAAPGTFVAHVYVVDLDSNENGRVTCSLDSKSFRLQKLFATEFKITTAEKFDYERQHHFSLSMLCHDHGFQPQTAIVRFNVYITDENDNTPVFQRKLYDIYIEENNKKGVDLIQVSAADRDSDMNGQIQYELEPLALEYFAIDPDTGIITASKKFDREEITTSEFYVIAVDGGSPSLTATATVRITILDLDDESPQFNQDKYAFGTFENQAPSTEVGRVTAMDMDATPYNTFVYVMGNTSGGSIPFAIHKEMGTIWTTQSLDREDRSVYRLTVLAVPQESTQPSTPVKVTIYVADKNDNAPIFDFPKINNDSIYLSHLTPINYVITRLRAHDLDTGDNAKLSFAIVNGNANNMFVVDRDSGAVSLDNDLTDMVDKVYTLLVGVSDGGEPQLSATAALQIIVSKDVTPPRIKARTFTSVLEGENLTIVLAFALATVVVAILIVIGIIIILRKKRRSHDRTERKKEDGEATGPLVEKTTNGTLRNDTAASLRYITTTEAQHAKQNSADGVVQGNCCKDRKAQLKSPLRTLRAGHDSESLSAVSLSVSDSGRGHSCGESDSFASGMGDETPTTLRGCRRIVHSAESDSSHGSPLRTERQRKTGKADKSQKSLRFLQTPEVRCMPGQETDICSDIVRCTNGSLQSFESALYESLDQSL